MIVLDLGTAACLVVAVYFFVAGTVGIVRFPNTLSRLHSVTKADNLGLGFVVLGLALQAGSVVGAAKLLLIWVGALVASATACFLVANRSAGPDEAEEDR